MSQSKPGSKSKSRKSNPTYITERHEVLDGEAIVMCTKQSKDVWQFRRGEGAYYRESLCTKYPGTANDGISTIQTAEGAMQEATTTLQRLKQLAIQAQNGINTIADKEALQKEVTQLLNEIDRIADTTLFAGKNLLDGNYKEDFLAGSNSGQIVTVDVTDFFSTGPEISGLSLQGFDLITGRTSLQ